MDKRTARSQVLGQIDSPITLVAAQRNEDEDPAENKLSLEKGINVTGKLPYFLEK